MTSEGVSRKRPRSASPEPGIPAKTYRSAPVEDRTSKFVALYSPALSAKTLQATSDFKSASHRIAAWRKLAKQRSLSQQILYNSGHDDDGEKYAGKKLETLLQNMGVEGAIVVARWYGGILLGPVRFTHIEHCAREAILKWKDDHILKKRTVEDPQAVSQVIKSLQERDENIIVLRQLLADTQKKELESTKPTNRAREMDYSSMSLQVLQQLEKARDSTISWILKEIDKAEQVESETTRDKAETRDSVKIEQVGLQKSRADL